MHISLSTPPFAREQAEQRWPTVEEEPPDAGSEGSTIPLTAATATAQSARRVTLLHCLTALAGACSTAHLGMLMSLSSQRGAAAPLLSLPTAAMVACFALASLVTLAAAMHLAASLNLAASGRLQAAGLAQQHAMANGEQAVALNAALDHRRLADARHVFTSCVSHEIRTPASVIVGALDLLRETALSPEQAEYVALIREGTASILSLVEDALSVGLEGKARPQTATRSAPALALLLHAGQALSRRSRAGRRARSP